MRVKKKNEEKKTLKIAILYYVFSLTMFYVLLFWTILKLATQSLLIIMYFYKGGSKESQNENIMYVRSGLKKKLVNFETSNNVTEPQVLYVHREDILNCSNIAVFMDTTQLKYHFLASPY